MSTAALDKPQAGQPFATSATLSGAIIGLQGDVLQGWALDSAQPERRLAIEVFIDGMSVALALADQYEPNAPAGDQFHGFAVQLRQSWLEQAHIITAKIANQDLTLTGQVQVPSAPTLEASAITSQVWHSGGLRVSGWAWDPVAPRRHVQISIRDSDRVIAQVTCNEHHQALAYRASADHGFTVDLPWELADGELHLLEVVNDLGQTLPGSPVRVCCRPEGLEGLLRQLDTPQDDPTFALLEGVAKEQALRLPKSAGWHLYPQWFDAFQKLDDVPTPAMLGTIGILLISTGDDTLEQASLASLGDDQTKAQAIATASPDEVASALGQLLEAGCDRILPIMAGDRLATHALPHLSALLEGDNAWGYADCDRDDAQGGRSFPWLKPVWDIDLFIGADIFTPGAIFGAAVVKRALAQAFRRNSSESCNWYELSAAIALISERDQLNVAHLPRVLYHRAHDAAPSPEQAVPSSQRKQAVQWLCEELTPQATVHQVDAYPALLRACWPLPEQLPSISLIVPTRDQYTLLHACLEGLLNFTDYPSLEIIVIDNGSTNPQTLDYLKDVSKRGVRVIDHPFPFNYSTINNRAVSMATGEIIGLINNDIEIVDTCWLKEMVRHFYRSDVGIVGAKLLWPNRMVQHGGVVVGINGLAAHVGNDCNEHDAGHLGLNHLTRQMSAVTAACLLTKKLIFEALSQLDEINFPVAFNDVDFCLKARKKGYRILWVASSRLIHAESASRGKDQTSEKQARALREQRIFKEKWFLEDVTDPFYSPCISHDYLSGPYGGLALPPTLKARRSGLPSRE